MRNQREKSAAAKAVKFLHGCKWQRIIVVCVLLFAGLGSYFWGNKKVLQIIGKNRGYRFGATYMTMNNPFYEIIDDEIRSVLEAKGDVLLTRDPALDVEKQMAQIQEMIDRKVDGIFINPVDWKAVGPALVKVKEAGIPIIVVDSNVFDEQLADCTVVSDNYQAGVQCADYLIKERKGGNILLLTHSAAKSGLDRIQGFKDTIEGHETFHILAEADCLGQLELAMPVTEKLLEAYPQTDVLMCLNDVAAMGAMAALKDAGLTGKIDVYGVDGSPDGKSMIEEGIMEATAAQFPRQIGREAAEAVYRILEGEQTKPVILIGTELVTRENLNRYGSDGWQ
ncbi:MAG: sugar ABC transporter substrate-binding protein [bacterium]|nr:sugar ABC transporter substrate-binding protein [bacterium]